MRLLAPDALNLAATLDRLPPRPAQFPSRTATDDSAYLLQRTQLAASAEPADPRYWTAYDRFMIERQARALRREYINALIARAWRRLRERLADSPPEKSDPLR